MEYVGIEDKGSWEASGDAGEESEGAHCIGITPL